MNDLTTVACHFNIEKTIKSIIPHGNGNINDSYLITSCNKQRYILQRINTTVFANPELLMKNISTITRHIFSKIKNQDTSWQTFHVIQTVDGKDYWKTKDNSYWRVISFIEDAESFDIIDTEDRAMKLGSALGTFHKLINDLSPAKLNNVLKGFHITPRYLEHYDHVTSSLIKSNNTEIKYAYDFIEKNRDLANILEAAKEHGKLHLRIMHGDPKINNVMFNRVTGDAISIIDLDTVKPGLIHYDIGDCVRSSCNVLGEEAGKSWGSVIFDLNKFRHIFKGYVTEGRAFLTKNDYRFIYDGIFLITFELGLRFFTDYLEGNVYFSKIDHRDQNLFRALTQFKLAESIQDHQPEILKIIDEVK